MAYLSLRSPEVPDHGLISSRLQVLRLLMGPSKPGAATRGMRRERGAGRRPHRERSLLLPITGLASAGFIWGRRPEPARGQWWSQPGATVPPVQDRNHFSQVLTRHPSKMPPAQGLHSTPPMFSFQSYEQRGLPGPPGSSPALLLRIAAHSLQPPSHRATEPPSHVPGSPCPGAFALAACMSPPGIHLRDFAHFLPLLRPPSPSSKHATHPQPRDAPQLLAPSPSCFFPKHSPFKHALLPVLMWNLR